MDNELSELRQEAYNKILALQKRFEPGRWWSYLELSGVHRNTLRALERQGYIENYKDKVESDRTEEYRESAYYRVSRYNKTE